jgi:hypothetical protein
MVSRKDAVAAGASRSSPGSCIAAEGVRANLLQRLAVPLGTQVTPNANTAAWAFLIFVSEPYPSSY